jgi:hypothetical protein
MVLTSKPSGSASRLVVSGCVSTPVGQERPGSSCKIGRKGNSRIISSSRGVSL